MAELTAASGRAQPDGRGQLDGKVAVVTGATAGIGLAVAKRFVAEGPHVFVTGRGQPALDAAVAEIGRNVTGVRGDAPVPADLAPTSPSSGALPLLNDGATIVLVSSIAGGNGTAGHGIYNAGKAAVRSLTRTLTVELKGRGIRVSALSPGPTDTQGFANFAGAELVSGGGMSQI